MSNLAFVITRFGPEVIGGAERLCLEYAKLLSSNHKITVFATTTSEMGNWNTHFSPGKTYLDGIEINRYPLSKYVSVNAFSRVHEKINRHEELSHQDYETWIKHSGQSDELFEALAARESEFDAIIFFQYLFGLTLRGWSLYPKKTIVWPMAHEEGPLFTPPVREMFQQAKMVFWNTEGERKMVQRCLNRSPPGYIVGCPVPCHPERSEGSTPIAHEEWILRSAQDDRMGAHYILYVGRIESMKNVELLVSYMNRLSHDSDERLRCLKLKLVGPNALNIQASGNIETIGRVSHENLAHLYRDALVLCQPSLLESFSLVMMESWLHETPVLVHGDCDVTQQHCLDSNGGLYFQDYYEFRECLLYLLDHPQEAQTMGKLGKVYVEWNYAPKRVRLNIENGIRAFLAMKHRVERRPVL